MKTLHMGEYEIPLTSWTLEGLCFVFVCHGEPSIFPKTLKDDVSYTSAYLGSCSMVFAREEKMYLSALQCIITLSHYNDLTAYRTEQ